MLHSAVGLIKKARLSAVNQVTQGTRMCGNKYSKCSWNEAAFSNYCDVRLCVLVKHFKTGILFGFLIFMYMYTCEKSFLYLGGGCATAGSWDPVWILGSDSAPLEG